MKTVRILLLGIFLVLAGCSAAEKGNVGPNHDPDAQDQRMLSEPGRTSDLLDGKESEVRDPQPLTLAELRSKYRSTFILSGPAAKREVALTFDDAPDAAYTPQVLDVLKKYGVKATFFVMGSRAEAHPDLVRRMVREGHVVGNHSYNHPNLVKLSDADFRDQVLRTEQIIRELAGYTPALFRAPYGNINEEQIKWLASQHVKIIGWNVDSLDWKGLDGEQVAANVLAHAGPGSIILQHSAGGEGEDLSGTVQALPAIIEKLRAEGIQLVTVPELLGLSAQK